MAQTSVLLPILKPQQIRLAEDREFARKRRKIRKRGRQMLRMYSCSESEGWSSEDAGLWNVPILIEDSDKEQDTQTEAVTQRCLCIHRQAPPTPEHLSQSGRGDTACETADLPEEEAELDMELVDVNASADAEQASDNNESPSESDTPALSCSQMQPLADWILDSQLRTAVLCGISVEL